MELQGRNLSFEMQGDDVKLLIVSGHVRQPDGSPLVGVLVRAFDQDLRSEEPLGQPATTDEAGRYEISYTAQEFHRAEKGSADLIVRVFDGSETLVSSSIIFNAQPVETVDLTVGGVYRGPSEYEELLKELTPVLEDVPLHELTKEDIDFLVGDTGLDSQRITWLAQAARFEEETKFVDPDVLSHIAYKRLPAVAFYAWFRQSLPSNLPTLLAQNMEILRRALESSIRENVIPFIPADLLDEFMGTLLAIKAQRVLKPAGKDEPASFGDLVGEVVPDPDQQQLLANLFVGYREQGEEFWQAVAARPEFSGKVKQLQTALDLGAFTGHYLPLVRELQRIGQEDPTLAEVRGLAQLDEADWNEVLQRPQADGQPIGFPIDTPGLNDQEKRSNYARTLNQFIENTFPTNVIAHRLDKDGEDSPFKSVKEDLKAFFTNNPTFEFGATPIDLYLLEDPEKKLKGVAEEKVEEVTAQLKRMQRVFKITPKLEQMSILLADDLHSSQAIMYFGKNRFVDKYSGRFGGKQQAEQTYAKAEQIHDMALMLYAKHSTAFNAPTPYVISGDPGKAVSESMMMRASTSTNDAAWRTLFGSIDLCDCEHCASVYSPAAYLVDILKFLKDGPTKNGSKTPLQILLERRPDLEHIELTCENTDTPLPYVDLVQEVLENAIAAPFEPFVIAPIQAWMPEIDLNRTNLSPELRSVFASKNIILPQNTVITVVETGKHWLITADEQFYTILKEQRQVGVVSLHLRTDEFVPFVIAPTQGWTPETDLDQDNLSPELRDVFVNEQFKLSDNALITLVEIGKHWLITDDERLYTIISEEGQVETVSQHLKASRFAPFVIAPIRAWTPETDLDQDNLSPELRNAFAGKNITLPQNATITIVETGKHWLVTDHARLYTVIKELSQVKVVLQSLQTGGTAEELSANPEHINPEAYNKLASAVFPWSLPLNLWVEEARLYLDHRGVQRHEVMETFFKGTPSAVLTNKGIAVEYLGLTSEEEKIIDGTTTGGPSAATPNPGAWNFWGLKQSGNNLADPADGTAPPAMGDWDVVLKRVSVFLQQSGLSYKELLELLDIYFINPIKSGSTRTLIMESTDTKEPATCNLSKLEIKGLDATVLGKIQRFVRLWRKLGWTMRDLDKAITALKPPDLNADFLVQLSHLQRLQADLKIPLVTLLSWWANIDTASYIDHLAEGQPEVKSLYERLFRNKVVINPVDEAFTEDANALSGKISEHGPTLVAALGISAADLSLLTTGTAAVVTNDQLNLANLSHLYRVASLAKALKLSIHEYLSVQKLTGIDPFAAIPATATEPPLPATGAIPRFVEKVGVIRASGFSIIELDYLLRHEYVASSGVAPSDQSLALLLAEIRDGLQKIVAEFAFGPDPTGELTRKTLVKIKSALHWEDADIERAMTLLDGTAVYAERLTSTSSLTITLPATTTGKISYDAAALKWVGTMSEGEKTLLLSFAADEKYQAAIDQLFESARDGQTKTVSLASLPPLAIRESGPSKIVYDSQAEMLHFTSAMTLPEKALLLDLGADQTAIEALFLQPRSFVSDKMKSFLDPADVETTLLDQGSSSEDKFDYVLTRLLAYSRISLAKSLVKQKLGEALKLEATLIELLLETLLTSRTDANQPAMSDFLALLDGGLSATYFDNQNLTGTSVVRTDPTINFNWNSDTPDPAIAVGTFSARWLGKVQPQRSETYTFFTRTDDGVRLWVDNQLIIDHWQDQAVAEHTAGIALKAGQLYDIKMEYYQNNSHAVAELHWSSLSTPKAIISANHLFPDAPVLVYQSLHKIARLISAFKISDEELTYLSTRSADPQWLDMTALPLVETQSAAPLFAAWERLMDLFRFRDSLPAGKIHLFSSFKQAANPTTTEAELLKALSERTGWSLSDLEFLASAQGLDLTFPDAYKDERALLQLQACFKLMKRLGASAKQLGDWGKLNQTSAEERDNARSIKSTVKAKYDDKQWLVVAKPLKDPLREKQRTALVSYLVAHPDPDPAKGQHWRDADGLYEHFLIDVEMSPCMLTTRIKQAISSVQLFVQRCLMNLEPDVSLTSEEAKEWREWRKQYRVWEANRKVFLYPENWLEPELRDDKSPFFKDLENELLQNDVTMDTAEAAFLHYLEKLDEVARLDIVGMYHQKETAAGNEKAVDILHVFGRTFAIPHIYYYRKLENTVWSAWEKVDLDIEGDHLIPVVWNRQLHLFWPIFTEKASGLVGSDDKTPITQWEVQLAYSRYMNAKWLPKKVSDEKIIIFPNSYPSSQNFEYRESVQKQAITFKSQNDINSGTLTIRLKYRERLMAAGEMSDPVDHIIWKSFRLSSTRGKISVGQSGIDSKQAEFMPPDSHIEFMSFVENEGVHGLSLFVGEGDIDGLLKSGTEKLIPIFGMTGKPEHQPNTFRILYPHQYWDFFTQSPFFYQDSISTFLVSQQLGVERSGNPLAFAMVKNYYQFIVFYHPYVSKFIKQLNQYGIDGLLAPASHGEIALNRQLITNNEFFATYAPDSQSVLWEHPIENIDFDYRGAYSQYNWELFFHSPFLIATRLNKNQHFEEAQKWFHYIFDPTATDSPDRPNNPGSERFWRVKPFYKLAASPSKTLTDLLQDAADLQKQVEAWQENPFKPYVVARLRLMAYMKAVVMKYIDNLIAWGDQLFRRETIESINEATQLYILAAQILGRRPEEIPSRTMPEIQTFNSIEQKLTDFLGAMVNIESYISPSGAPNTSPPSGASSLGTMPLFCIPKNDKLLGYWSTVADRLFKIRHCMNIEGVVRQLPLFEPPIDPALLVRAAAAGVDISSALNDINATLPHYRFNVMLQKATELSSDVKVLGGALLSALEKRDAEALALLRSSHEIQLLNAVREIREQQISETTAALEGLRKSREVVNIRYEHYRDIEFISEWEGGSLGLLGTSLIFQALSTVTTITSSGASLVPTFTAGASGISSPVVTAGYGGKNVADAAKRAAEAVQSLAATLNTAATMSSTYGSYWRRWDDWKLQEKSAHKELEQIDKQILAAEIRVATAGLELKNHDLQVENAKEVEAFMKDKYTNQELYDWMVGQISSIYFQSYQMAYDIAKRAERAFRHELGLPDSNFIQFGYWDSLKSGLLAGEKLHYDLKRMDVAYLDQNKREYEITKHISLVLHNPLALIALKETGQCEVELPEALFDADYPGHYMRRLKSVSLTIPCVVGPYTSINCTLTLLSSKTRINSNAETYAEQKEGQVISNFGAIQSITTSHAQNDSGTFEQNFRDERYLPFEGAGAVSRWRIDMPKDTNAFDFNTLSDVVLHLKYTAREGGDILKEAAKDAMQDAIADAAKAPLMRLFSAKHEFPTEWYSFLHPVDPASAEENIVQRLPLALAKERFPFQFRGKTITIKQVEMFLKLKNGQLEDEKTYTETYAAGAPLTVFLTPPNNATVYKKLESATTFLNGIPYTVMGVSSEVKNPSNWVIEIKARVEDDDDKVEDDNDDEIAIEPLPPFLQQTVEVDGVDHFRLNPEVIEDIYIVCHYSVTE